MLEKIPQQRFLFESERSFRLLVEGVADYALYARPPRRGDELEHRRARIGYTRRRSSTAFRVFILKRTRQRQRPFRALKIAEDAMKTAGASARTAPSSASVVIDPIREGGHLGFAKITRDITERREAQLA